MSARARGPVIDRQTLVLARVQPGEGSWSERHGRLLWTTRRLPHHDPYSSRAFGFSLLLFAFVVLNLMDAVTTLYGVSRLGWDAEANLWLRWMGQNMGAVWVVLYKALVVSSVAFSSWVMHRGLSRAAAGSRSGRATRGFAFWRLAVEVSLVVLVVVFTSIVANNVLLIARHV